MVQLIVRAAGSSREENWPMVLGVLRVMPHHFAGPACMLLKAGGKQHATPLPYTGPSNSQWSPKPTPMPQKMRPRKIMDRVLG